MKRIDTATAVAQAPLGRAARESPPEVGWSVAEAATLPGNSDGPRAREIPAGKSG